MGLLLWARLILLAAMGVLVTLFVWMAHRIGVER
jgi:hypothetical protein